MNFCFFCGLRGCGRARRLEDVLLGGGNGEYQNVDGVGSHTHKKKQSKKKKWTTAKGAQLSNQCCLPAKSTKKGREGRFVLLLCESLTQVGFERNIREGERFSTKNTTHEKKKLCLSNRRSSNGWGVVKKGNTTGWASIKNIRLFFFLAQS
jgi:hypothetical protein